MNTTVPKSTDDDESALIDQWRGRLLAKSEQDDETSTGVAEAAADGVVDEDAMIDRWRARVDPTPAAERDVEEPAQEDGNLVGQQVAVDTETVPTPVDPVDAVQHKQVTPQRTGFFARLRQRFTAKPAQSEGTVVPELQPDLRPQVHDEVADVQDVLAFIKVSRRKQRTLQAAKFLLAVLLPTFGVWYYVNNVAVPLYTADAVISVSKPAPETNAAGLGILGAVSGGGQMREAFMVLEFLQSPAAFEALEDNAGLISYYQSDDMDPVGRVRDLEALQISQEQSLSRYVESSINVQNGLISTSIRARSRNDALNFLSTLLTIAEAHINGLSAQLFDERMAQANGAVTRAEQDLQEARRRLVEVQIANGEVDPQATIAGIYEAINLLEIDRLALDRRILALEATGNDNTRVLPQYINSREELDQLIGLQRARLVDASSGRSLNEKLAVHETARAAILVAEQTLAAALAGRNEARQAAELGVSRFQIVVPPQAPQIANYPQRWQTTALAFFIFLSLLAIVSIAAPRSD